MPDDAFVNKLSGFLKNETEKAAIQHKQEVLEARVIKANAPKQWQELRDWVKAVCEQVNRDSGAKAMIFRDAPSKELLVDIRVGAHDRLLRAIFDEPTSTISYNNGRGKFTPFVASNGFGYSDGSNQVTIEEMGQMLIQSAIDMR